MHRRPRRPISNLSARAADPGVSYRIMHAVREYGTRYYYAVLVDGAHAAEERSAGDSTNL